MCTMPVIHIYIKIRPGHESDDTVVSTHTHTVNVRWIQQLENEGMQDATMLA